MDIILPCCLKLCIVKIVVLIKVDLVGYTMIDFLSELAIRELTPSSEKLRTWISVKVPKPTGPPIYTRHIRT